MKYRFRSYLNNDDKKNMSVLLQSMLRIMKVSLIPRIFLITSIVNGQDPPLTCIGDGVCFKGSLHKTELLETPYQSYQGIKYAQPPIDNLR